MANDVQTASPEGQSVTGLVTGIVADSLKLFEQQLTMLKAEVREDFGKTRDATISLALGAGVAVIGLLMLCLMLVHLLDEKIEGLTLWGAYGIVGGLFAVVGAVLLVLGKKKFDSFNPLPDETAGALKENLQWLTKPK